MENVEICNLATLFLEHKDTFSKKTRSTKKYFTFFFKCQLLFKTNSFNILQAI